MRIPDASHAWNVTPKEAVQVQRSLRAKVRTDVPMPLERVRLVAGVDVSAARFSHALTAGIVVWDRVTGEIVDTASVQADTTFPYVPGLLSFREIPILLETVALLGVEPDVWMVDGHGIAHPRRLGIATHFGLAIGRPTIGCGKSKLCGTHDPVGEEAGSETPLRDGDDVIGTVLRSKARSTPIIVSPGNGIDLASSVAIVRACLRGYRIPEPTRLAHLYVNAVRTEKLAGSLFDR